LRNNAPEEPDKGGRPEFKPSAAQRRSVSIAAGGGMSHEDMANALGISRNTLEKHFEAELSRGAMKRRMEVLDAMHVAARKGNVTAQRAYLERTPQLAVPPLPAPGDGPTEKLGKKEQAARDATTAQSGTGWEDILPRSPGRLN
jgi:hypothetical protein